MTQNNSEPHALLWGHVSNLPSLDYGGSSALREHQIIHPATAPSAGLFMVHQTRINPPWAPLYMSMGKQEMMQETGKDVAGRWQTEMEVFRAAQEWPQAWSFFSKPTSNIANVAKVWG